MNTKLKPGNSHLGGTQPIRPLVAEDLTPEQIQQLSPLVNSEQPENMEMAKALLQGMGLIGSEVRRGLLRCVEGVYDSVFGRVTWTMPGFSIIQYNTFFQPVMVEFRETITIKVGPSYPKHALKIYDAARAKAAELFNLNP